MKEKWNTLLAYRIFLLIFTINTCINIGQQMINTLVPKYASALGLAATMVGIISGMFSFSALCLRPFANLAFDKFGKKRMLQVSAFLMCVTILLYSLAQNVAMLFCARILHGVCYGCVAPLCLALAGDSLPDEKLGAGIGIFTLAQAIAQAIGPGIGLALQEAIGYAGAFRCGMVIVLVAFVLTFMIPYAQEEAAAEAKGLHLRSMFAAEVLGPSVCLFFMAVAQASIVSFLVIYGGLLEVKDVGLYFTVYAIVLFISRPVAGRLSDKLGFEKVILPGIACSIGAFLLLGAASGLGHFIAAAVLAAFGYGASQPAIQAMSMKMVSPARRAVGANTNYIFTDLGAILGSYIVGFVIDLLLPHAAQAAQAYATAFRVMVIPMLLAAVSFLLMARRTASKEALKL